MSDGFDGMPQELPAGIPPPPPYVEPSKGSKTKVLVALGVTLVLVVAGALLLTRGSSEQLVIKGTYELFDSGADPSIEGDFTNCKGTGGYGDISSGMPIQVQDANGKVIGSGAAVHYDSKQDMLAGINEVETNSSLSDSDLDVLEGHICVLHFEVKVPRSDFYVVKARRGDVTYSYEEMTQQDFHVEITLGD